MNVKLKKRNNSEVDSAAIEKIAANLSLHPKFVEILFSRGINSENDIIRFLSSDSDGLHDPFKMKGMSKAVERLKSAVENDETVVVYGDYDADGICAAAILSLYLRACGLDVRTHIPNRIGDGYGLNISSLEKIIEDVCPDLILTCDCGISGYDEIEYCLDLGVDVIVTDHHEVSEKIPECIVLNPKQSDCNYPCKFLCGAGVALKLVEAMGGREAMLEYCDLACVATIADLVPMLDENRLIVRLGMKAVTEGKNIGLHFLLDSQDLTESATCSDIAFKIAPRINAAGRIGDAYRAFEMLTSDDTEVINSIIEEINEANVKRKAACDKLYDEAVADLVYEDLVNFRCIVLSSPDWEKGITGIVAARLSNEFRRPAFIMVPSGDGFYKGTCRSVEGINIYDALSSVGDILTEFGGHSQAAGFSIKSENIDIFKTRMNEYLLRFPIEHFLPYCLYDVELKPEEVNFEFIRDLDRLEPTGNSFPKPLFKMSVSDLSVAFCKTNINHTTLTTASGLQIFAFNFYNKNHYALGDGIKDMIVELQLSEFNNKEYSRGVLKEISPETLYINDETASAVYVKYSEMYAYAKRAEYSLYDFDDLKKVVGDNPFGTMIIAFDRKNYEEFNNLCGAQTAVLHDYMFPSLKNNYTRIAVAPDLNSGFMLSAYNRIILLDKPITDGFIGYLNSKTKAEIFVPSREERARFVAGLHTSRLELGKYYDYIRKNTDLSAANIFAFVKSMKGRVAELDISQMMLAINVFAELGLIKTQSDRFRISLVKGERRELSESKILSEMENLKSKL